MDGAGRGAADRGSRADIAAAARLRAGPGGSPHPVPGPDHR